MCLLANEGHLSDTRIFAGVCGNNRQVIVYENKVSPPKPGTLASLFNSIFNLGAKANFMCLPVPLKDGLDPKEHINVYNFSSEGKEKNMKQLYDDFFLSLNVFSDDSLPKSICLSAPNGAPLEVFQVGGYKCSFARTPNDVLQLDPSVFGRPTGLHSLLNKNYAHDFAFLCCIFEDKSTEFHPILYTHPLSSNNKLFIPTRHYHGTGNPNAKVSNDWEHSIYVFGADPKSLMPLFKGLVHRPYNQHQNFTNTQKVFDDVFSDGKDSIAIHGLLKNNSNAAMKITVSGHFDNLDITPNIFATEK